MRQKPADELFGIESHGSGLVPMFAAIVLPLKGDACFRHSENAVADRRSLIACPICRSGRMIR
jgi:hypothetical protein